ncbi:MAG: mechanosensitive ion channel domain-containing protein, partial [Longimicrobiales bacterium]
KASANVAFAIAALFLTQVWFTALRSVGTFLGLLSAGLAISLKDLVADLAGWAFIAWRRPFELGDRIQIGDHAGDVVDRSLFQFTIMEIGNWV